MTDQTVKLMDETVPKMLQVLAGVCLFSALAIAGKQLSFYQVGF